KRSALRHRAMDRDPHDRHPDPAHRRTPARQSSRHLCQCDLLVAGDGPMTDTVFRKSVLLGFRKSAFTGLLLSASVLAGCATNRTPQFSYDASVPPLPTVQVTATDDRPRPL